MSVDAITERDCARCGGAFQPTTNRGAGYSYCPSCVREVRRIYKSGNRLNVSCAVCGSSLAGQGNYRYCVECKPRKERMVCPLIPDARWNPATGWHGRNTWQHVPLPMTRWTVIDSTGKRRRLKYPRLCLTCGAEFRVHAPSIRKSYCSSDCQREYQRRPILGPPIEDIGPVYGPPFGPQALQRRYECQWCNLAFWSARKRKYCSTSCSDYSIPGRRALSTDISFGVCRLCGKTYCREARHDNGFCSSSCNTRHTRKQRKAERRAHHRAGESFTLREIAERDGWRCHLCGGKVPDRQYAARDKDPTLDHLVPVSAGGEHTRANVALAHNRCNWERSNEGAAQLRLVG